MRSERRCHTKGQNTTELIRSMNGIPNIDFLNNSDFLNVPVKDGLYRGHGRSTRGRRTSHPPSDWRSSTLQGRTESLIASCEHQEEYY
jgi:hypothetical protein